MAQTLPDRSEIETRYKWNAESVFPTTAGWDAEAAAVTAAIDDVKRFKGRLAEGPAVVGEAVAAMQEILRRVGVLGTYAGMAYAVDTKNADAAKQYGRVMGLYGQAAAAVSFIDPELLAIGEETLRRWLAENANLAYLGHYADDLFRRQAHVRSAEVEELLGMVSDPFGNLEHTFSLLADADFKFPPAVGSDGTALPVSNAAI